MKVERTVVRLAAAAASAALLLAPLPTAGASGGEAVTGTIEGVVTGPGGVPIPGATVTIGIDHVVTDVDGSYRVDGLEPPRQYVPMVAAPGGYVPEWFGDAYRWQDGTLLTITPGATLTADVELGIGGAISGTVDVGPGAALADLTVQVAVLGETTSVEESAPVSADGSYVVEGLPADRYLVEAVVSEPASTAGTWYAGSATPAGATAVELAPAGAVGGIDLTLERCGASEHFTDIDDTHRFCTAIDWLGDTGASHGYADGTFRATSSVTRGSLATILHRLAGSPAGPFPDPGFTDVPADSPLATAVRWLAAEGLVAGYADGTYRPAATLTRGALVTIIYRLAGEPPPDPWLGQLAVCYFVDLCTPDAVLRWSLGHGVVRGYLSVPPGVVGSIRLGAATTRQNLAVSLVGATRAIERLKFAPNLERLSVPDGWTG